MSATLMLNCSLKYCMSRSSRPSVTMLDSIRHTCTASCYIRARVAMPVLADRACHEHDLRGHHVALSSP